MGCTDGSTTGESLKDAAETIYSIVFSPDGSTLASREQGRRGSVVGYAETGELKTHAWRDFSFSDIGLELSPSHQMGKSSPVVRAIMGLDCGIQGHGQPLSSRSVVGIPAMSIPSRFHRTVRRLRVVVMTVQLFSGMSLPVAT